MFYILLCIIQYIRDIAPAFLRAAGLPDTAFSGLHRAKQASYCRPPSALLPARNQPRICSFLTGNNMAHVLRFIKIVRFFCAKHARKGGI